MISILQKLQILKQVHTGPVNRDKNYTGQRFFYGALPKGTGSGEINFFTKIPYRDLFQNPYRDDFEFEQKNPYGDFPPVL